MLIVNGLPADGRIKYFELIASALRERHVMTTLE